MRKGSMTVEAALVMSLMLFVIMWLMQASISMYQQTMETAGIDWIDISEAALEFRNIHYLKELLP